MTAISVETAAPILSVPLVIRTSPSSRFSDEQFFDFCQVNKELRIERTAAGEIVIMSPTGGRTSQRNFNLAVALGVWSQQDGTGTAFDSSGGFRLPSGAVRSPDLAWVENARLDRLAAEAWERFLPLCPDFVVELRSPSDALADLQRKMEEYRDNGARLGWLIDPLARTIHVYRPAHHVERLIDPATITGDPILPGFVLDLRDIWGV